MQKFVENLKRQAEENPVVALGAGAAVVQAISKLVQVNSQRKNSKTWKKEVERRAKKSK